MLNFIVVFCGFFIAVALARIIIPRILIISLRKRLFDTPDARKVHKKPVSRLGGVSFFPAILFTVTFLIGICYMTGWVSLVDTGQHWVQILFMCTGLTLLYIVGIADDLIGVRYRQKFIVQLIAAFMFPLAGLYINDFYGLFGIHAVSPFIGIPLTLVLVIFITNAINLIDGIDGLASGLSSVALLVFTFLFISKGLWSYAMLSAGTFGVLVPFFYYNVFGSVERARKIFMGDTGSLTLGYTLSFLAIKYSQHNTDIMPYIEGAFLIAFSTMIIPAFDVVRVVLVRIREGHSPFEPDKNHIHHKLLAIGLSPRRAMLSLLSMSCAFSAANILLVPYINNTVLLIADIVIWVGLNLWWDYLRDRK